MTTNGAWPAEGVSKRGGERLPRGAIARADEHIDVSEIDARTFKALADMEGAAGLGCWHVGFPFMRRWIDEQIVASEPPMRRNRRFVRTGMSAAQIGRIALRPGADRFALAAIPMPAMGVYRSEGSIVL